MRQRHSQRFLTWMYWWVTLVSCDFLMDLSPLPYLPSLSWLSHLSWASQSAKVVGDQATVYRSPNKASEQVATLSKGHTIYSSNNMVKDHEGTYWYKVRVQDNQYGYVMAKDLLPSDLQGEMKRQWIGQEVPLSAQEEDGSWSFLIRAMGLAGGAYDALLHDVSFVAGGEGEATICVPFSAHGYFRRFISVGAAYYALPDISAVAGAIVIRFYQDGIVEPELRLRIGQDLNTGDSLGGVNAGIAYPFSLSSNTHLSGFLEVGSLTVFSEPLLAHVWGSVGLGLHF